MPKIFKLFSQNKKALFLVLGLGLIFSFVPSHVAYAFWWDDLINGISNLFNYIVTLPLRIGIFILMLPILVTALLISVIYLVVVMITSWLIHISLLVGITPGNPLTPGIINIGWTFTRDFVNMFFILILVFIGLATILKLREYEAKKLLPKLILVALLINFTPVIVGFIVDAGNIFTNFLLVKAGNITPVNIFMDIWTELLNSVGRIWSYTGDIIGTFGTLIGIVVYGVVVIIFFALASWVYLWVMLTFFLRIVELWILMILCPIAFFSQVLPPSKTVKMLFPSILHWDKWWEEFLQWVIVGIPLGLFIYLSNWMIVNTDEINTKLHLADLAQAPPGGWPPGLETAFVDLIIKILAPTVGLVLLYKGYKIAKETAPAAAMAIIEGVKKVGTVATALGITAITAGAGAGAAAGLLGKAAAGAQRLETGMGRIPIAGKALKYGVGKPISWATRGMERVAAPPLLEYAAKTRRVDWGARFKGMEAPEIAQQISLIPIKQQRVSAAGWMQEQGLLDKPGLPKGFKDKMIKEAKSLTKDPHYQKSATEVFETLTRGVDETVALNLTVDPAEKEKLKDKIGKIAGEISQDVKIRPQIEAEAKEKGISFEQAARDMAARENWVGELKAGDVKNIEKKSLREDIGTRRGMKSWSSSHMSALVNNFKKEVVDDALNETGGLNAMFEGKTPEEGKDILEKLYRENPRIVRFFATTPAGREWNWGGRKFLPKNKKGRPDFGAFEAEMEKKKPEEKEEKKEGPKEGYVEGKGPTG